MLLVYSPNSFKTFLVCVCGCVCACAHVWVCIGAQVPQCIYGHQKTAQQSWFSPSTILVLGIPLRFSGRAASIFTH